MVYFGKPMRATQLLRVLPVAAAAIGLTSCVIDLGDISRYSHDFHYSYPIKSNGRLTLETFNGAVEISGWDQDTVDISGSTYGPSQEAADTLRVSIDHNPDAISIRVERPSERRNNQGARFTIKIPRGAVLERVTASNGSIKTQDGSGPAHFRTSNGAIRVADLQGELEAQTSNGSIEVKGIDGDVRLHTSNSHVLTERVDGSQDVTTTNGSVTLQISRPDRPVRVETSNSSVDLSLPAHFSRDLRVSTNNGGITLRMPSVDAHLLARTSNSSISSDFDVKMQGEFSRNHMDGTIGAGGPLLDLNTSNASIRLVRM
jgi:hypothetical protein